MQSCATRCNDPLIHKIYNLLQHEEEFLVNDRKSILRTVRNSIFLRLLRVESELLRYLIVKFNIFLGILLRTEVHMDLVTVRE